jgi:hypothetical protein
VDQRGVDLVDGHLTVASLVGASPLAVNQPVDVNHLVGVNPADVTHPAAVARQAASRPRVDPSEAIPPPRALVPAACLHQVLDHVVRKTVARDDRSRHAGPPVEGPVAAHRVPEDLLVADQTRAAPKNAAPKGEHRDRRSRDLSAEPAAGRSGPDGLVSCLRQCLAAESPVRRRIDRVAAVRRIADASRRAVC